MVFFLADINSVQCYYTDRSYGIYVGPILYYQTFRCSDSFWEKRIKTREKVRTEVTYRFSDYRIYYSAYMPGIYVKTSDLGFDKELLLRLDIPHDFQNKPALKQQISNLSFVKNSSFSNGGPGLIRNHMSVPETESLMFNCIYIDRQFLETFDIELVKGRKLLDGDFNESCYINEKALRIFGWENLENRRFNNGKENGYNIVGVVRDFNIASLHKEIEPVCLIFSDQYSILNIRLLPGNLDEQMKVIQGIWKSILPGTPFTYTFLDEYFNSLYHKEDQQGKAIAMFSLIAFIITCLGMLGQIMQVAINKTKEIGIRRINGAKVSEIMSCLLYTSPSPRDRTRYRMPS